MYARMFVSMAVLLAAAVAMRAVSGQINHMAVAHAALGDDVIGKFLHVGAASLEHSDLKTVLMIEVHVQRGVGEIMTGMEIAGEPLG